MNDPHVIIRKVTDRFYEIRDRLVAAGVDPFDILEEGKGKQTVCGEHGSYPMGDTTHCGTFDSAISTSTG